jgi:lysozyme
MSGLVIDISSNNSPPDFDRVKHDGVIGVIVKATEGITFTNPRFVHDFEAARKAGLVVGSYHFARQDSHPSLSGARQEAEHYVSTMRSLPRKALWGKGDFLPILDFEKGTGDHRYSPWRDEFLLTVKKLAGHYGMLYTSPGFNVWAKPKRGLDRLWVAHYTSAPKPMQVPGYSGWDLWQFTDKRVVAGCHEPVDASRVGSGGLSRIVCHNAG